MTERPAILHPAVRHSTRRSDAPDRPYLLIHPDGYVEQFHNRTDAFDKDAPGETSFLLLWDHAVYSDHSCSRCCPGSFDPAREPEGNDPCPHDWY